MIENEKIIQIPMFRNIAKETFDALCPFASMETYKKGNHIFLDREQSDMVFFLLQGNVNFYKIGHNGEKRSVLIGKRYDMLNEECVDGSLTSTNCECLNTCIVLTIPQTVFIQACAKDSVLMMEIMSVMGMKIRRLHHLIKNNMNSLTGEKRVAAKLWKLAKDYGVPCALGIRIDLPLSITYLAELVGSKRETISRQIKHLCELELITIQDKNFIVLDNGKLLKYIHMP